MDGLISRTPDGWNAGWSDVWMARSPDGQESKWPDGQKSGWPDDRMARSPDNKMTRWSEVQKMARCPEDQQAKYHLDIFLVL